MSSTTVKYEDNSASAMRTGLLLGLILGTIGGFAIGMLFVMAVLRPTPAVELASSSVVATAVQPETTGEVVSTLEATQTSTTIPPELVVSIVKVTPIPKVAAAVVPEVGLATPHPPDILLLYQVGMWTFFGATVLLSAVFAWLMRKISLDELARHQLEDAFNQAVYLLSRYTK